MISSTTTWRGGTCWSIGRDALEVSLRAVDTLGQGPAGIVIDRGWAATPSGSVLLRRVLDGLRTRMVTQAFVDGPVSLEDVRQMAALWRSTASSLVVGVGGGSVMDAVSLSALPPAALRARDFQVGRSGLVVVPPGAAPLCRLVVPTTLGTGAEVSGTACCNGSDGKLLILGEVLRPEYAAIDPTATSDLPVAMVREAIVEILARLLVPLAAPPAGEPAIVRVADAHALADLATLRSVAARGRATGFDESTRLTLAALSAHSHAGWGTMGRRLFASPLWFVATELSSALGLTKAATTALLLPAWAAAVRSGDERWGDAARLRVAWSAFESGAPPVAGGAQHSRPRFADPVAGIARFCRSLVEEDWTAVHREAGAGGSDAVATFVAQRSLRRWGAGLPMLGPLDANALHTLVWEALRSARQPALAGIPGDG